MRGIFIFIMDIKQYLDATYLKTPEQAGLSESENDKVVKNAVAEAVQENFKLIMIRPGYVAMAKKMIIEAKSKVAVGTVIAFPEGTAGTDEKLSEAQKAIDDGADELDFVADYNAFKAGEITKVKDEVVRCTQLGLSNGCAVKWIIEVAALTDTEIIKITALIKNCVISNFKEDCYSKVYVKSSTGFYKTENGEPNGATLHTVKLMLENSYPLPVKAAGGVRTYSDALAMIKMGVKRIGTSSAKALAGGDKDSEG